MEIIVLFCFRDKVVVPFSPRLCKVRRAVIYMWCGAWEMREYMFWYQTTFGQTSLFTKIWRRKGFWVSVTVKCEESDNQHPTSGSQCWGAVGDSHMPSVSRSGGGLLKVNRGAPWCMIQLIKGCGWVDIGSCQAVAQRCLQSSRSFVVAPCWTREFVTSASPLSPSQSTPKDD